MRSWRALLLSLAATAACARRAPPPDLSADPAALLAQVEQTQARVERVTGEARVKVQSPAGGGTVTQLITAERPDRLRLVTLDFFGNPAAVLVADGGRFALLDLREGVFLRGAASPRNLARLLPLAIPAPELVQLLCGAAPVVAPRAVAVAAGDGVARLTLEGDGLRQRLDVGAGAAVHGSVVTTTSANPLPRDAYDLAFDRFDDLAGRPFPRRVRLEAPSAKVRLELSWKEIEANGVLPEGSFGLAPPPGVRIVELDGEQ